MTRRIPLIARDLKRLYTGFLIAALALFVVCSMLTEFNPDVLVANGDAFWEFITQDFPPPALPKGQPHPRRAGQRGGHAGAGALLHHGGGHSGLLCRAVRQ